MSTVLAAHALVPAQIELVASLISIVLDRGQSTNGLGVPSLLCDKRRIHIHGGGIHGESVNIVCETSDSESKPVKLKMKPITVPCANPSTGC
jgi:hypothetical protein